jgi:OOP family OmpA-OmpF porin
LGTAFRSGFALAAFMAVGLFAVPGQASAQPKCAPAFTIYFETGSFTLNAPGEEIVETVAPRIQSSCTRLVVTGHSDAAEARRMPTIGRRRAEAVRASLVAHGVTSTRLVVVDARFSQPARRTARGVGEPLNRRVVIGE